MIEHPSRWGLVSFIGGVLCLDFVNTVLDRTQSPTPDCLNNYDDLLAWGKDAGILTVAQAQQLAQLAQAHPVQAEDTFSIAYELRESLYTLFVAEVTQGKPDAVHLDRFKTALNQAIVQRTLIPANKGYQWHWQTDDDLSRMIWPIALSASELLTSANIAHVRQCPGCGWLFLDTSKNKRRRWCDMRACGNREKVKRHRKKA
ncbi:MAG: ABATE domain-containing protein [Cyanobacteria bacterium J06635_15]